MRERARRYLVQLALKPTLDGGKARPLATSALRRSPQLPNVPAVQDGREEEK